MDVAASLRDRESRREPSDASRRCLDLEGGFSLWAACESALMETLSLLPPSRVHVLCYETLVTSPISEIESIGRFLNGDVDNDFVADAAAEVRSGAANSYRNDERLSAFYRANAKHPLMTRFSI